MCSSKEKWNMLTLRCEPISESSSSDDYDGSTSIYDYIIGGGQAAASIISAFQKPVAPINNYYGSTGSGSMIWIVIAIAIVVIILLISNRKK